MGVAGFFGKFIFLWWNDGLDARR